LGWLGRRPPSQLGDGGEVGTNRMVLVEVETGTLNRRLALCEERRVDQRRAAESRVARADAKVNAVDRKMVEMRSAQEKALGADDAALRRAIASIREKADQAVGRFEERAEAARAARQAAEVRAAEAEAEADGLEARLRSARQELGQSCAREDSRTAVALRQVEEQVVAEHAASDGGAGGVLGGLRKELERTRRQQEEVGVWREHLTGVTSMHRDENFSNLKSPRPIPFDLPPHLTVFDGFGTFGKRPVLKTPRGFQGDLARARCIQLGVREAPSK